MTYQAGNQQFIIDNLGFRIGSNHPGRNVQVGTGNPYADVLVVQPHIKMPERDAITGALKNFNMLGDAYRVSSQIVDFADGPEYPDLAQRSRRGDPLKTGEKINREYLKELIEIIRPLVVVACGPDVLSLLRERKARSFETHTGKKFPVRDLTSCVFYATLNPAEYGFARAPLELKAQGKSEWIKLSKLYQDLREKQEKARWTC